MSNLSPQDLQICKEIMENEWFHYSDEIFRYITYPDVRPYSYVVSNYGNIISLISNQLLTKHNSRGYENVTLRSSNNKQRKDIKLRVHRLVAWEFCEGYDPDNGCDIINHIDRNRSNNRADNLEWCTSSHNNLHTGLNENYYSVQRGIPKEDAIKICEMYAEGHTPPEVFHWYTGNENTCSNESLYVTLKNIYYRKTYKNVSKNYSWDIIEFHQKLKNKQYKFDDETLHHICKLFEEGYTVSEVLEDIGKVRDRSSRVILSNIYKRVSHKHISDNYKW